MSIFPSARDCDLTYSRKDDCQLNFSDGVPPKPQLPRGSSLAEGRVSREDRSLDAGPRAQETGDLLELGRRDRPHVERGRWTVDGVDLDAAGSDLRDQVHPRAQRGWTCVRHLSLDEAGLQRHVAQRCQTRDDHAERTAASRATHPLGLRVELHDALVE